MSELSDARAIAAEHRAAFLATAHALQAKAVPLAYAAHDAVVAVEHAKRRSEQLAGDAIRVMREPRTVSTVVGVATAFVSFKLFRRLFRRGNDGDQG